MLKSVKQIYSRPLEDAFMLPLNADAYGEFLICSRNFNIFTCKWGLVITGVSYRMFTGIQPKDCTH